MHIVSLSTKKRCEFIDITAEIAHLIQQKKITSGVCIVFCPHTTAALTINENADPSVRKDILHHLESLVPEDKGYTHMEGNADSHIKSSLLGSSLNIIIENGQLTLGTWQGIYFCEFDGPRSREVWVKIVENK